MEKNFVKVHSTKDITIVASLVIIGLLLALLPIGGATNVTGYIVIATGLLLIPVLKSGYKDAWEGKRYTKKEFFYANDKKNELIAAITNAPENITVEKNEKSNTLRLELYYSKETGRAFMQLQEYVPYKYEPRTDVVEHEVSKIAHLIR
ncbi:MAG: hypothetical protein IJ442_07360 [Bacteroidaceae bacterium]|nr:hypothetical protein [Bacteroidaceae bacterium]